MPINVETMSEDIVFGRTIYRYDVISSTQDVARDWAERGTPQGTVVTARAMTAGRGRRGRIWHTTPGANLNLTAIAPSIQPDTIWQVPLLVGMAVADALVEVSQQKGFSLRFPNDILLQGRKVGGILIETAKNPQAPDLLPLIGIGINVSRASLPPDVLARAISLEDIGVHASLLKVEAAILRFLTLRWQEWEAGGVDTMLISYHAYLDQGARRNFVIEGRSVPCRVVRIYANGAVMIESEDGSQSAFHAAQVVLGDD